MKSDLRVFLLNKSPGDWIGFLFFGAVAGFAVGRGISLGSPWMGVTALHNGLIAILFLLRKPAVKEDNKGLILVLLVLSWPAGASGNPVSGFWGVIGLAGLIVIFWSLVTLGRSFGLAPADRGLVTGGPYRFIRHAMYLGELVYQAAVLGKDLNAVRISLFLGFILLQVVRILREEKVISNYSAYTKAVRWRLFYGIW